LNLNIFFKIFIYLNPCRLLHVIRWRFGLINKNSIQTSDDPFAYLLSKKRYETHRVKLIGREFQIVDTLSFYYSYREIFNEEIYFFKTDKKDPVIIDCGANVGTSILYFKNLYPDSTIIAFEADTKVYNVCKRNIEFYGLSSVTLYNLGLWDEATEINFRIEGADAGRIDFANNDFDGLQKIKTTRLTNYLEREVDFLKIDIEGAEYRVLKEIKDKLGLVKKLFIEYHSFYDTEQVLDEILFIIKDNGFRYQLKTIFASRKPFEKVETNLGMDLQINIFAYR